MTVDLAGRVALVTGGNRGLGKAMAGALAASGARVILVARDLARLEEAAAGMRATGGAVSVLAADVADEARVEALRDAVQRDHGRLDILINNAGINLRKPLVDFTLDEWRSVIDTNLTSVFLMCRAFVPLMRGRGYGRIINIGSTMSRVSIAGRAAYSSSKAAILGLTRALALELAPEGITVNAMCPGPFATELNTALLADPEKSAWFLSRTPVGRWGNVEEVGEMAVYLCSPKAGFVTGADLAIDGGWLAQ